MRVTRRAPTPAAARALQIAEALVPPRAAVLAASWGLTAADSAASELWWMGEIDGVRAPYAATGTAARYFVGLVPVSHVGETPERVTTPRVAVSYEASAVRQALRAKPGAQVRRVWVVRAQLDYVSRCGRLCGQLLHIGRTVVLSSDASRVLALCGDGRVSGAVSVLPERAAGSSDGTLKAGRNHADRAPTSNVR